MAYSRPSTPSTTSDLLYHPLLHSPYSHADQTDHGSQHGGLSPHHPVDDASFPPQTVNLWDIEQENESQDEDEWEWEEEETYCTFELESELPKEVFKSSLGEAQDLKYSLIGLETSAPYLQIGNYTLRGELHEALGTEILLKVVQDVNLHQQTEEITSTSEQSGVCIGSKGGHGLGRGKEVEKSRAGHDNDEGCLDDILNVSAAPSPNHRRYPNRQRALQANKNRSAETPLQLEFVTDISCKFKFSRVDLTLKPEFSGTMLSHPSTVAQTPEHIRGTELDKRGNVNVNGNDNEMACDSGDCSSSYTAQESGDIMDTS